MSKAEAPILHIAGTIAVRDYKADLRVRSIPVFLVYLLITALLKAGTSLYHWFADLRDGVITFGEWLRIVWESMGFPSVFFCALILVALYLLLIRPFLAGERMRRLHPEGIRVKCDFYDDRLVLNASGRSEDGTIRLMYADVRRRITETRYSFTLSTDQRNKLSLFKTVMKPDEVERVRRLLKERCPQRAK